MCQTIGKTVLNFLERKPFRSFSRIFNLNLRIFQTLEEGQVSFSYENAVFRYMRATFEVCTLDRKSGYELVDECKC